MLLWAAPLGGDHNARDHRTRRGPVLVVDVPFKTSNSLPRNSPVWLGGFRGG